VAVLRTVVVIDRRRLRAYLVAMTACGLAATVSAVMGADASVNSLGLLVVTYAPLVFVVRPGLLALHKPLLAFFERCTAVVALLAVGASLAQLAGWLYTDYLGKLVPPSFLLHGYNTFDAAHYGSTYIKTNAFVCLEPSAVSQLSAIGLVLVLLVRASLYRVPLYVGALVASLSGTGIWLLFVGLVVLGARRGRKFIAAVTIASTIVAIVLIFTPPGHLLVNRATEFRNADSSGNARFVQPYKGALDSIREGTASIAVGHGPGSTSKSNQQIFERSKRSPLDTVMTKLVREYGVPATVLFMTFVAFLLIIGTPSPVLSSCALLLYLVLSGGLLAPAVVYLCAILVSLFPTSRIDRTGRWPCAGAPPV